MEKDNAKFTIHNAQRRYIDADKFIEVLKVHFDALYREDGELLYSDHMCIGEDVDDLIKLVNEQPAVKINETKQGKWIGKERLLDFINDLEIVAIVKKQSYPDFYADVLKAIKEQRTADVVEVCRCKECANGYNKTNIKVVCKIWGRVMLPEDYCSYGAKMDLSEKPTGCGRKGAE